MFFHMVYKSEQIFLPFCHNTRVWQTDGQTEFSSLDRVCIPCSAVKTPEGFYCVSLQLTAASRWSWYNALCRCSCLRQRSKSSVFFVIVTV